MSIRAKTIALLLAAVALVALAGCGQAGPPEKGLVVSGPGVRSNEPPWAPQYAGLARRIKQLGLPTGDSEKFHIHALLSVYDQSLPVIVPANIGIDDQHHVNSTLHTHTPTGVIHIEAPAPYHYTLGDFFAVWGVRFGGGTLGSLQDNGSNRVWVYANGKLLTDPAQHVIANGDDISIGYGTNGSFPHQPGTYLLKQVMSGKSDQPCSITVKKQTACLAPKRSSKAK
jgi:hypothetical protein